MLDELVATVTANRDKWAETILEDERHLRPVSNQAIMRSSVIITVTMLIGHVIPLLPFVFLDRSTALILAVILSGLVLFGPGRAKRSPGSVPGGNRAPAWSSSASAPGRSASPIGHLFHASGA